MNFSEPFSNSFQKGEIWKWNYFVNWSSSAHLVSGTNVRWIEIIWFPNFWPKPLWYAVFSVPLWNLPLRQWKDPCNYSISIKNLKLTGYWQNPLENIWTRHQFNLQLFLNMFTHIFLIKTLLFCKFPFYSCLRHL